MSETRKIRKVLMSKPTIEGAGVRLRRAFGHSEVSMFDPFLMLDDFRSSRPDDYIKGFPWHPHRGIETMSYVLRGQVEHGDSMGNKGVISGGDVQWMTAGSGIIHQEMPTGDKEDVLWGFQLWANLPAQHKMMAPRYQDVKADLILEIAGENGTNIRVVCGKVDNAEGPVQNIVIDPTFVDITVPARSEHIHPTKRGHTVLSYVIDGRGYFCKEKDPFTYEMAGENYFDMQRQPFVTSGGFVLFQDGDQVMVSTEEDPVRFLLFSGMSIGEPWPGTGPS